MLVTSISGKMLILIQWILGDLYRLNSQAERQQGMLTERLEIQGQMSKPPAFTCQVDATLFPQENKVTFGAAMLSQDGSFVLVINGPINCLQSQPWHKQYDAKKLFHSSKIGISEG